VRKKKLRNLNFLFLFRKGKIYLVFEYVEKNLLEKLEEKPEGLDVNPFLFSFDLNLLR